MSKSKRGLTSQSLAFLNKLKVNNNREWFHANKKEYEQVLKQPAADFCEDLSAALEEKYGISIEHKIFRINRDLRFSKDKTPYNTHIRAAFAPSTGSSFSPSFFFSLETERVRIGLGVMSFSKQNLADFRQRVADGDGADLQKRLKQMNEKGLEISDPELKRVPAPYGQDHRFASLLRRKSLSVWLNISDVSDVLSPAGPTYITDQFEPMEPLFDWLRS